MCVKLPDTMPCDWNQLPSASPARPPVTKREAGEAPFFCAHSGRSALADCDVAADVSWLNFRYYDGSQWQDSWDSTQSNKLPQSIEVTVHVRTEWHGEPSFEKFTSRFYLPVAAQTPDDSTFSGRPR